MRKVKNNMAKKHVNPDTKEKGSSSKDGPTRLANTLCQLTGIYIPIWRLVRERERERERERVRERERERERLIRCLLASCCSESVQHEF